MKILATYFVLFMSLREVFAQCGTNQDVFQGCSDDCTGQIFCIGDHLIPLNCGIQSNGQRPYCNIANNLCESTQTPCNNNPPPEPTEFQCPDRDAIYPDPLDCTKYYICKNKVATSSSCLLAANKYNPKTKCEKMLRCIHFSHETGGLCRNKLGKYVVHPLDKNVYVKCEKYPIVTRCPIDHIFDLKEEKCRYDCTKKGVFPDNDNVEYYFLCAKVGLHWQPKHEKCPNEMIYDRDFAGCVLRPSSEDVSEAPSTPLPTTTG